MSFTRTMAGLTDYKQGETAGARFRAKRIGPLLSMIDDAFKANGAVNILDLGGREEYWNIVPRDFLRDRAVTITIVNLPEEMKAVDHGMFKFMEGDGCDLRALQSGSFDIVHANSVVEHVGDWHRMTLFAKEIRRLGPRYFVQTPNFWFPLEPHCMTPFFHWLPKATRVWMVTRFNLGHWGRTPSVDEAVRLVESARLLNRAMMQELFSDAELTIERFFGLPKSLISIKK